MRLRKILRTRTCLDNSESDHNMTKTFYDVEREAGVFKSPLKSVYRKTHSEVNYMKRSRIRPRKYLKRVIKEIEKMRSFRSCGDQAAEKNHFHQKCLNAEVQSAGRCASEAVKLSDFRKKVLKTHGPATEMCASLALSPAASSDSGVDLSCDLTAVQTFRHVHQKISQNCTLKSVEVSDKCRRDAGDHFVISMPDLSWLQGYKIQDIIQPLSITMGETLLAKSLNTVMSSNDCLLASSDPKVMNLSRIVDPVHCSYAQNGDIIMESESQVSYCSTIDMKLKESQSSSTINDHKSSSAIKDAEEDVDFNIDYVTYSLRNKACVKECSRDQGTVNQGLNTNVSYSVTSSSYPPLMDSCNLPNSSEGDPNAVSMANSLVQKLDTFDASTSPKHNLIVSSGSTHIYNLRSRARREVLDKFSVGASSEGKKVCPVPPDIPLSAFIVSEKMLHQTEFASDKSFRMVLNQSERQYSLGCLRRLCSSHFLDVKQDSIVHGLVFGDEQLAFIP